MINIKKETFFLALLIIVDFLLEFIVVAKIQVTLNLSGVSGLVFYKTCSLIILICLNYFLTKQVISFKFRMSANIIKGVAIIPAVFFIFFIGGSKRIPEAFVIGIIGAVPEEYLFRGIILGKILKLLSVKLNNKRMSIIVSVILSSLIFGSMHAINLTHQPLIFTVAQMIQTFGFGMLLAAVYIKSGSIIFPMLIHFSLDSMVILIVGYSKAMMGSQHVSVLSTGIMLFVYIIISLGVMTSNHENKLLKEL